MMKYFPIYLDLHNKHILVVGAGNVGVRKVNNLLATHTASITVLDTIPCPTTLKDAQTAGKIQYIQHEFTPCYLNNMFMVFVATNNNALNTTIASLCAEKNILCNMATTPEQSDFIVPACIYSQPVCLALATEGSSPALTKHIRQELEDWLGNRYTGLAMLLGKLRPLVLALGTSTEENTRIFRSLVASTLGEELAANDKVKAQLTLTKLLPQALHTKIGELIHDL